MPLRRSLTLLLALLAFLPAACGGNDEPDPTVQEAQPNPTTAGEAAEDSGSGGAAAQGTVEIVIKDFKFEPETAKVKVGQEVTWRNEDSALHDAFSEKDNLDTPDLKRGETAEFTPEEAGTIEYICSIHPQMKGTLEIVDQ